MYLAIKKNILYFLIFLSQYLGMGKSNLGVFMYKCLSVIFGRTNTHKIGTLLFQYYWYKVAKNYTKVKTNSPRLFWGTLPIISNKYWSNALKEIGYSSKTVMNGFYESINQKDDYDIYTNEILKEYKFSPFFIEKFRPYFLFDFIVKNFDIFHFSCFGTYLDQSQEFKSLEAHFIKVFGGKVIVLPYGGDYQQISKVLDISLRHVLQVNYPMMSYWEDKNKKQVDYWIKNADIFIPGFQVDNIGRWSMLPFNTIVIDTKLWKYKSSFSQANGIDGVVKIIHTPNHRGIKGTEYIINAVSQLQKEGLKVQLLLIEKMQNAEVRRIMQEEADILVEQLVLGYALSAIEGMASGLPVLSNLSIEDYTRVFRRYSYLNECPILSTSIEEIKDNLRILVTNPQLREELGRAGRKYVEKYHSYQAAQYMFGKIYDKIWYEKEVDLMNMYHPLNPDAYNNQYPLIKHPLVENKLPSNNL